MKKRNRIYLPHDSDDVLQTVCISTDLIDVNLHFEISDIESLEEFVEILNDWVYNPMEHYIGMDYIDIGDRQY